jgi:hypothetical protein
LTINNVFVFPILASPLPTLFIFTKEDKPVYGFPPAFFGFSAEMNAQFASLLRIHKLVQPPNSYY